MKAASLLVLLAACSPDPGPPLGDSAAEALGCLKEDVEVRALDEDGATAACRGRGVYLERVDDRWIVMQSFPLE